MNYQQSIDYLFSLQKFGIKLGLRNIKRLLSLLDNPQKKLPCIIHIAGTNGKGSTAAFLASILTQSGYKTGLYTSPHLSNFTERMRINNSYITKAEVASLTKLIKNKMKSLGTMTFFEIVTAMALVHFAEHKVDFAILEVGMGGRLDATNVVSPLVSIITNISKEHEFYLGSTIMDIAREKAGIIKRRSILLTGATQPSVLSYFKKRCQQLKSGFFRLGKDFTLKRENSSRFVYHGLKRHISNLELGLRGDFQSSNAALSLAAVEILMSAPCNITDESILKGLRDVYWPGRCELVKTEPLVVLDGAHNPAAMANLKSALNAFDFKRLFLVMGIMEDKNIGKMVREIATSAEMVLLCRPHMQRAASPERLADVIKDLNVKFQEIEDVKQAVLHAIALARHDDLVCVTGSLFTIGEARELFKNIHTI